MTPTEGAALSDAEIRDIWRKYAINIGDSSIRHDFLLATRAVIAADRALRAPVDERGAFEALIAAHRKVYEAQWDATGSYEASAACQALDALGAALSRGATSNTLGDASGPGSVVAALPSIPIAAFDGQHVKQWPKGRDVCRLGDMSPPGDTRLRVLFDSDNDVCVEVLQQDKSRDDFRLAAIEFCNGAGGGGGSPRTRVALIALMCAIEADNEAAPHKAWPRPTEPEDKP